LGVIVCVVMVMEEILYLSTLGVITDREFEDSVDCMNTRSAPENRSERYGSFDI
jgi:hypothetical protein